MISVTTRLDKNFVRHLSAYKNDLHEVVYVHAFFTENHFLLHAIIKIDS